MSNLEKINNQQLTVSQRKLISKTEEAGNLSPVGFAKSISKQSKIKFLVREDVGPALGFIFQNITLLMGIKEPIPEANKTDIKKMIISHYGNMSLEEIVYAFELERYGKLKPKSEHYQLVNSTYVALVLDKYKEWLQKVRRENNISLATAKIEEPTISDIEKHNILIQGCLRCWEEFKTLQTVKEANSHIYDFMFDDLKIHEFTTQQKMASISVAKKQLNEEAKRLSRQEAKDLIRKIQNNASGPVINRAKRLLLNSYFMDLGKKDFVSVIEKYKK